MLTCSCGFSAKSSAGLSSHARSKGCVAEVEQTVSTMAVAMERTLVELDRLGRFEEIDTARIQSLRSMAVALDANPFNSQMWRELRESLNEVTKADDDADDSLAAALAQIAGAASVGDTETTGT